MARSGTGSGGCRGPAWHGTAQRSRAIGDDARVLRRDVPRGDEQERPQSCARGIRDAVRLDGEPVSRMQSCVRILLRSGHARVPRPRRGARLRLADRRQDQRRRGAPQRTRARHVAARPGHARHEHRPVPARRGPLPAHAGDRLGPDRRRARRSRSSRRERCCGGTFRCCARPRHPSPSRSRCRSRCSTTHCRSSVEPGTPTAAARLDTVRAATEAGFGVTVFLMPILPHLTDSIAAIDDALRRIKDAGRGPGRLRRAASAARASSRGSCSGSSGSIPSSSRRTSGCTRGCRATRRRAYRSWLAKRVRPLVRVHGLDGHAEEDRRRAAPCRASPRRSQIVTTSSGRRRQRRPRLRRRRRAHCVRSDCSDLEPRPRKSTRTEHPRACQRRSRHGASDPAGEGCVRPPKGSARSGGGDAVICSDA